jgi:hypothetical protein
MAFTKVTSRGIRDGNIGIRTTGGFVGTGFTVLNFVGAGNTFAVSGDGTTIDISIAGGGGATGDAITKESFSVTSTQSVFNLTNEYSTGLINVYVNGLKLPEEDYTENPPLQVTLAVAAEAGDTVEFIGFRSRISNTDLNSEVTNLTVTGLLRSSGINSGTFNSEQYVTSWVQETSNSYTVSEDTTLSASSSDHTMFTKHEAIVVGAGASLIIDSSSAFVVDLYQL